LPAKAASLALQFISPHAIIDFSRGLTCLSSVGGSKRAQPISPGTRGSGRMPAEHRRVHTALRSVAVVCSGCAHLPVKPFGCFIICESRAESKFFCVSTSRSPRYFLALITFWAFNPWEIKPVRGVCASAEGWQRCSVSLTPSGPRPAMSGVSCIAGQARSWRIREVIRCCHAW
jgi:hypothetical protein